MPLSSPSPISPISSPSTTAAARFAVTINDAADAVRLHDAQRPDFYIAAWPIRWEANARRFAKKLEAEQRANGRIHRLDHRCRSSVEACWRAGR